MLLTTHDMHEVRIAHCAREERGWRARAMGVRRGVVRSSAWPPLGTTTELETLAMLTHDNTHEVVVRARGEMTTWRVRGGCLSNQPKPPIEPRRTRHAQTYGREKRGEERWRGRGASTLEPRATQPAPPGAHDALREATVLSDRYSVTASLDHSHETASLDDVREASVLSDRVAVLSRGRVLDLGSQVRSFVRSIVRSFVRSFVRSIDYSSFSVLRFPFSVRSFVRAFVRSFVRSPPFFVLRFLFVRSFVRSFARPFARSFVFSDAW